MIFIDDTSIKVSGTVLPGLIKSTEIKDEVLIEEQEVEGSSVKPKQVKGYDDAKVTIELILEDSAKVTRQDKLKKIQNIFKKSGQTKPKIHTIVNEHISSRGIKQVVFKGLASKEENKRDQIVATLEFVSYKAIKITAKKKSSTPTDSGTSSLDPAYQSYLNNNRGSAPTKTASTPAIDDSTPNFTAPISRLPIF